jgi:hypothetical protein
MVSFYFRPRRFNPPTPCFSLPHRRLAININHSRRMRRFRTQFPRASRVEAVVGRAYRYSKISTLNAKRCVRSDLHLHLHLHPSDNSDTRAVPVVKSVLDVALPLCLYLCASTSVPLPLCLYLCASTSVPLPLCLYLCASTSVPLPRLLLHTKTSTSIVPSNVTAHLNLNNAFSEPSRPLPTLHR